MAIDYSGIRAAMGQGGGQQQPSQSGYAPGQQPVSWQEFLNQKQMLDNFAAQQNANDEMPNWLRREQARRYQQEGGTSGMYSGYREANPIDWLAIQAMRGSDWFNNMPGEIAGGIAGLTGGNPEEAKEAFGFDQSKFDIFNPLSADNDWSQVPKFALSIPGMIPGGILEGIGKGYEAVTGAPIQENRMRDDGSFEIADYTLDASQRAGAGVDSAISLAGTLTGGMGRLVGGIGKAGAKKLAGSALDEVGEAIAAGATASEIKDLAEESAKNAYKTYSKAVHRQDLLDGLSKGVVTRALETGRGGKPLGTVGGLISDMGDEAVEEFVQSYAEDLRMKTVDENSFERAKQGAAWGALGGGIMGGVGRGLSHLTNIARPAEDQSDFDPFTVPNSEEIDLFRKWNPEDRGKMYVNDKLYETMDEEQRNRAKAEAAVTYLQTFANNKLKFDDAELGVYHIEKAFYQSETSANAIAKAFGMENRADEIRAALQDPNVDKAAYFNDLIDKTGRKYVSIAIGRNPDTKNGAILMNLTRVHNDRRFSVRPEVMQILGSDWDSDKAAVYFDPQNIMVADENDTMHKIDPLGYASEMLLDPETKKSTVEWIWSGIGADTQINLAHLNSVIKSNFGDIHGEYKIQRLEADGSPVVDSSGLPVYDTCTNAATYFTTRLHRAFKIDDASAKNDEISDIVMEMGVIGEEPHKKDSTAIGGRTRVNNFLHTMLADDASLIQTASNAVLESAVAANGFDPNTEEGRARVSEYEEVISSWEARGLTGGSTKFAQMAKSIGFLTYLSQRSSGNPIFRQYGGIRYWVNSVPQVADAMKDAAEIYGCEPIIKDVLRQTYGLITPGVDPTRAIEGMCDAMLISELMSDPQLALLEQGISDDAQLDAVLRKFVELQSKYARIYNECQKELSTHGYRESYESAYRTPLDGKETLPNKSDGTASYREEYTGSVDSPAIAMQFAKVFDDFGIGQVLSNGVCSQLGIDPDMTWSTWFTDPSWVSFMNDIEVSVGGISQENPNMAQFIRNMALARGKQVKTLRNTLEAQVAKDFKFEGMRKRYEANGNKIDPQDVPQLLALMDFVYEWVGARNAARLGVVMSDGFLDTEVGKRLTSGDPETMLSTMAKLSIAGQYADAIMAFNNDSDPAAHHNGAVKIQELGYISPLHGLISSMLLNGDDRVYDWCIDPTVDISQADAEFRALFPGDEADFLVNAFQSESGTFSLSSVSQKVSKSKVAAGKIRQYERGAVRSEVEEFESFYHDLLAQSRSPKSSFVTFVKDAARARTISLRSDLIALNIYANATLDNSFVEKATIPQLLEALYASGEISMNGGALSALSRLMQVYTAHADARSWASNPYHLLACLTDPEYEYEVFDSDQGKRVTMTQAKLVREAGVESFSGELTDEVVIAVLKKYPQLAGYLCDLDVSVKPQKSSLTSSLTRSNTLTESFESWMSPRTDTSAEALSDKDQMLAYQFDRARKNIKDIIFPTKEAQHCVTYMIPDHVLEGDISVSELTSESNKALDELVDHLLYRLNYGDVATSSANRKSQAKVSASELVTEVWNLLNCVIDQKTYDMIEMAQDATMPQVVGKLMTATMARRFGVSVSSSGISGLDGFTDDLVKTVEQLQVILGYLVRTYSVDTLNALARNASAFIDTDAIVDAVTERNIDSGKYTDQNGVVDDDAARQAARDEVSQNMTLDDISIASYLKNISISDTFLVEDDFKSPEYVADKIVRKFSWDPNVADKSRAAILRTINEHIADGTIDKFIDEKNIAAVRHSLILVSQDSGISVNHNAAEARKKVDDDLEKLVDILQQEMERDPNRISLPNDLTQLARITTMKTGRNWESAPPMVDFTGYTNPTKQAIYSNESINSQASGNPVKVGVNGSEQQYSGPLGHLPAFVDDENLSYSSKRTKAAVLSMRSSSEYSDMRAVIQVEDDNGQVVPKVVGVNTAEFDEYVSDKAAHFQIDVYLPEDNAHGLPTHNMPYYGREHHDDYRHLSGAYQRLIQHTMEAMVIKSKKRMDEDAVIVQRDNPVDKAHAVKKAKTVNYETMRNVFSKYRKGFVSDLEEQFVGNDDLKKLGFGRRQALMFAQSLTPGISVTYISGVDEKGNNVYATTMLDASLFVGDSAEAKARFESHIADIGLDLNSVIDARVYSCTFEELNYYIAGVVNKARNQETGEISADDAETAALSAMSNWTEYDTSEGDVGTLMSKVLPLCKTSNPSLPLTDSPLPPAVFRSIVSGGTFGAKLDASRRKGMLYPSIRPIEKKYKSAIAIGDQWIEHPLGVSAGIPVTNAWIDRKGDMGTVRDNASSAARAFYDSVLMIQRDVQEHDLSQYSCGAGIFYDGDRRTFRSAVNWAVTHASVLYVNDEYLKNTDYGKFSTGKYITIKGRRYSQINAFAIEKSGIPTAGVVSSGATVARRSDVDWTLVLKNDSDLAKEIGQLSDAQIGVLRYRHDKAVRKPPTRRNISLSQLFGDGRDGVDGVRFITKEEARAYLERYAEQSDNGVWHAKPLTNTPQGKRPVEWLDDMPTGLKPFIFETEHKKNVNVGDYRAVMDKVVKYLADYAFSKNDEGDPLPSVIGNNDVIAIVHNGLYITPVYAPNDVPTKLSMSDIEIKPSGVTFGYAGSSTVSDLATMTAQKVGMNVRNEAFKGMAYPIDADAVFIMDSGATAPTFHPGWVTTDESESSRATGIDESLFLDLVYHAMICNHLSPFYELSNGSWDLKPAIKKWKDTDRAAYDEIVNGNVTMATWNKVASGALKVFDPATDRHAGDRNKVFASVVRTIVKDHGLDPRKVFGSYRLVGQEDDNGAVSYTYEEWGLAGDESARDLYQKVDYRSIFHNFTPDTNSIMLIFNGVDQRICAPTLRDAYLDAKGERYIVSPNCEMAVAVEVNGKRFAEHVQVRAGENAHLDDVSSEDEPTGYASVSGQHITARAADVGYDDQTIERGIAYNNLHTGHYEEAFEDFQRAADRKAMRGRKVDLHVEYPSYLSIRMLLPYASKSDVDQYHKILELDRKTMGKVQYFRDKNGQTCHYSEADIGSTTSGYGKGLHSFNSKCKTGSKYSYAELDVLVKCYFGMTWNDNVETTENGKFAYSTSDDEYVNAVERIITNMQTKGVPIVCDFTNSADVNGRYIRPLIPKASARQLYQSVPELRKYWENQGTGFEGFVDAMKEEQHKADQAIMSIKQVGKNKSRYIALSNMSRAAWMSYGETSPVLPIFDTFSFEKYNGDMRSLLNAISQVEGWDSSRREFFMAFVNSSAKAQQRVRDRLEQLNIKRINLETPSGKMFRTYSTVDEARDITNLLNNAAELSKMMSVLNPFVTAGNLVDRSICQGFQRGLLYLGQRGIGPFRSRRGYIVQKSVRDSAVEDPAAVEFWNAYRESEFNSEDFQFIANMLDKMPIDQVLELAKERKYGKGTVVSKTWGHMKDLAYKSASAGTIGLKSQMKIFIDRFAMFAREAKQEWWFEPAQPETLVEVKKGESRPMTNLEAMLAQPGGFTQFMKFCLSPGSPSFEIFLRAANSAKEGDMAQKNAVGVILTDLCQRIPFGNFVMTTAISRFPMYGLNVTGRALNLILPMSSINYCFTQFMGKTEYGKKLGLDNVQIHTSMREAMMVDMMKIGVFGVAIVLFGLSAVEPPDDERKWGIPDEWMVFGTRAGENWWMQDVLGMALPLACFWKACSLGKPRYDIVINGLGDLCYSNPIIRCGDVASWLMNPAESLIGDFEEDAKQFKNPDGSSIDFGQWIQANAFNGTVNWVSQFFTPSILRELYRASEPYEKSYKKTWKRSASGQIVAEGDEGVTQDLPYDEAMKHKLTQRNPVLAWMFAGFTGDDSYILHNMPNTVMYDDYQLAATKGTSIAGLDDAAKMAKVNDLIGVLMSCDVEDLADQGWHFDYETTKAIASQIWDNYHAVDEWYNDLKVDGQLDYYVLGNGDWNEGQRIAGELYNTKEEMKQFWSDLYYNKLKDTPLTTEIVTYNRYNTTYAKDVNGEIYATGIRRSPLDMLPFTNAPGTMTNPEGTAGYENDFATISAVTGMPLDSRALIPTKATTYDLPKLEAFADDGNGGGYSDQHNSIYGKNPSSSTTKTTTKAPSGGGGGGYGGGGGGGGRGGGAPNTYAPSVSLPKGNSSRIMTRDRKQSANLDYLRPDFETKGSREAYKRSDI